MSETVRFWFEYLYRDAIEEAKGTIENERMWELGYNGEEPVNPHTENIKLLKEYIKLLEEKMEELK